MIIKNNQLAKIPLKKKPQPNTTMIKFKKSHTCEEGGAHLRFSFRYLLMNLKNHKNQNFEKMKKNSGNIIILHMCTKNHNHMQYSS